MKHKLLYFLIGSGLLFSANVSFAESDLLTGDTRLACEAVLCLSSGEKPNECNPSLKRYFSIHKKKMSDTLKARKNFLNLCPASKQEGMPALINAISQGAGRCDAAELNRVNRRLETFPNPAYVQCTKGIGKKNAYIMGCERIPKTITKQVIDSQYPSYCKAYFEHGWTYKVDSVQYVGDKYNGGKWINR